MTSREESAVRLTAERVRHLSAEDLGLEVSVSESAVRVAQIKALEPDDPILRRVTDLLETYGGVIFVGPPGTSKSWYAARLALTLTEGDESLLRFVQFHPSYQYEDFMEGFLPRPTGGFELVPKHFVELCEIAKRHPDKTAVLVIDELSRGDPARIFGEALTYIEKSKRGLQFSLASGTDLAVPPNFVLLATMNSLDRGVDEVDAALDRRLAKIAFDPDDGILSRFLAEAGMPDDLQDRVVRFFRAVNSKSRANPYVALGHTYFIGVANEDDLRRLWEHQLRFHFDKAFRLDPEGRAEIDQLWNGVLRISTGTVKGQPESVDTGLSG